MDIHVFCGFRSSIIHVFMDIHMDILGCLWISMTWYGFSIQGELYSPNHVDIHLSSERFQSYSDVLLWCTFGQVKTNPVSRGPIPVLVMREKQGKSEIGLLQDINNHIKTELLSTRYFHWQIADVHIVSRWTQKLGSKDKSEKVTGHSY